MNKKIKRILKRTFSVDSMDALNSEHIDLEKIKSIFNKVSSYFDDYEEKIRRSHHSLDLSTQELTEILHKIRDINIIQELILTNIDKGFIAIAKDGKCLGSFSSSCLDMFLIEGIEGEFIWDLLELKDTNTFKQWFDMLFQPNMPLESLLDLAPKIYKNNINRTITLEFKPMFKNKVLIGLVLFAKDITDEIKGKQQAEERNNQYKKITNIFSSTTDYQNYVNLFNLLIKKLESKNRTLTDCYEIKQDMHSLKGLSGYFFFDNLAHTINSYEVKIRELNHEQLLKSHTLFNKLVSQLKSSFETDRDPIKLILEKIGLNKNNALVDFEDMENHLIQLSGHDELAENFYSNIFSQDIKTYFHAFDQEAQRLGESLQKEIYPIHLKNSIKLPPGVYDKFFQTLIHIIRNIMDHGIEKPSVRQSLNKPIKGKITFDAQKTKDQIVIKIKDDGGGIDPEIIKQKFVSKGMEEAIIDKSKSEILQLIFTSRFSTAKKVTSLSGMGIGVAAVRSEVERLGGTITVDSEVGVFTEFTILLPYYNHKSYIDFSKGLNLSKAA